MTVTLYEVGGCVRDELLELRTKDVDFAVEADSYEEMRGWLEGKGFQIFVDTPEYFTIRAHFPRQWPTGLAPKWSEMAALKITADFVLCRREGEYTDGRRPDDVTPGTIYDDLARRDFTVNAMARDGNGDLIDPHHGLRDLRSMTLRCVGGAEARLTEDALRALRALRFRVTKDFIWDDDLYAAMTSEWLPPLLANVSRERVREELQRTFKGNTLVTLDIIMHELTPELTEAIFGEDLWLQPTLSRQ